MRSIVNQFVVKFGVAFIFTVFAAGAVFAQKPKPVKPQPKAAVVQEAAAPVETPVEVPEAPAPARTYQAKICVATPKTNLAPVETATESLRNYLVQYLSGPAAEIVVLESMVAVQQQAEAVEKGCGYYLTLSMMQKKKGGGAGFGDFLKQSAGAAPLLSDLGASKTATTVATVATKSSAKMTVAGDLALTIKAKDEVTLEYTLFSAATGTAAATGKIKAKAGKDGEDIVSSLLEQAVNAVLTVALKK
ncbi:MAG: hypothetical protein WKF34_05905 [Pyrinomonadaceae bacterium]